MIRPLLRLLDPAVQIEVACSMLSCEIRDKAREGTLKDGQNFCGGHVGASVACGVCGELLYLTSRAFLSQLLEPLIAEVRSDAHHPTSSLISNVCTRAWLLTSLTSEEVTSPPTCMEVRRRARRCCRLLTCPHHSAPEEAFKTSCDRRCCPRSSPGPLDPWPEGQSPHLSIPSSQRLVPSLAPLKSRRCFLTKTTVMIIHHPPPETPPPGVNDYDSFFPKPRRQV